MSAPPKQPIALTITITESPEGKLGIAANIPGEASGTVALVMADAALEVMKEMMRLAGVKKTAEQEGKLQ